MQRRFGYLQENRHLRIVLLNLPNQFATDTSCGAADENHFVLDNLAHVFGVHFYLRTLQQILDADGINAADSLRVDIVRVVETSEIRSR